VAPVHIAGIHAGQHLERVQAVDPGLDQAVEQRVQVAVGMEQEADAAVVVGRGHARQPRQVVRGEPGGAQHRPGVVGDVIAREHRLDPVIRRQVGEPLQRAQRVLLQERVDEVAAVGQVVGERLQPDFPPHALQADARPGGKVEHFA